MSQEDWEVVTALGTWAAVLAALWIATTDRRARVAETRDSDAAQARLVTTDGSNMGGLMVVVTNWSLAPILGPELDEVTWEGPESPNIASWRVNPRVTGARAVATRIAPGGEWKIPVDFLDSNGKQVRVTVGTFRATVSFHDAKGLTWSRTANRPPSRVLDGAGGRVLSRPRTWLHSGSVSA